MNLNEPNLLFAGRRILQIFVFLRYLKTRHPGGEGRLVATSGGRVIVNLDVPSLLFAVGQNLIMRDVLLFNIYYLISITVFGSGLLFPGTRGTCTVRTPSL